MLALGGLGLGCDRLGGGTGEEQASVAAEDRAKDGAVGKAAEASPGKTGDPGAAPPGTPAVPGATTPSGSATAPVTPAMPGAAATPGSVAPPGTPAVPGAMATPVAPGAPGAAVTPGAADPESPTLAPLAGVTPSEAALSEKMQRRLRSKLREQHDARTQLASSIALPQPDGGVVVLALYEYSQYEACVGKSDGSPEARKACANPTDDNERVLADLRKCTGRGLVRAHFGPPPKSQPAYGGELTVEATRPLEKGGCTIGTLRRFALEDADADGQPELALDVVGKTPETEYRSETQYDVFTRTVGWYRTDLSPQFEEEELCEWYRESLEEGRESTARRIELRDTTGDGRPDLVVDEVSYENDGDCDLDEAGWLAKIAGPEDGACGGKLETRTLEYDAGADEWDDL